MIKTSAGLMISADDSREREYGGHLTSYYDEIISFPRAAEAVLIFGPGEAKGELRKRIVLLPADRVAPLS